MGLCIHDVAAACHLAEVDVWVRLPLDALGRTCDVTAACRLGMSAAWVRLPPGALDGACTRRPRRARRTPHAPVVYWPSTPLCHGGRTSSILVRGAGHAARYANRQSDQAQTLEKCGFDSHPCYLGCVGRRWDAGRPVKPPHTARQVRFLTGALEGRSVGLSAGHRVLSPGGGVQLPDGLLKGQRPRPLVLVM